MLVKFFLIITLLSLSVYGCKNNQESRPQSSADELQQPVSNKAPDFELKTLDGKTVKLSDYKGKVVIVDFWATWCGPCRRGIPDLIEIQDQFDKELVIIGISLDQENTIDQLQPFINYFKIDYTVVLGDNKVVSDYGGIGAIPTSFIINQDGEIVNKYVGLMPKQTIVNQIKSLLEKS